MTEELKKKILEKYLEHTEKGEIYGTWHHVIADELTTEEKEKTRITSECDFLQDEGCLEEIISNAFDKRSVIGIRITSKGKTALQTIYNPEWVKQNNKEKQEEKELKKRQLENVESSLKWTKIGVIGAIGIGIISIIYTAIKP